VILLDIQRGSLGPAWRSDPCAVLYDLARNYSGAPVQLSLGDEAILVFQDAEAGRHIAHTNVDNFRKNLGSFNQFFGRSRLTSDDEQWRKSSRLSQPAIAATNQHDVAIAAERFLTVATQAMLAVAAAEPVEIDPFLNDAAGAVIAEVTLGFAPADLSPTLADDFRKMLIHGALTTWNVPGAPQTRAPEQLAQAIEAKARLKRGFDGLTLQPPAETRDLLSRLIGAVDQDIDAFAEVCTLLFAGFDTSSAALGWAMWLLAGAPALQDRLRQQIDACYIDGRLDFELLSNVQELSSFIGEALRIFPPVPILSRIAVADDVIAGIPVAAGQKVLFSVIGLHHNSAVFLNPRQVSLQRFPEGQFPPSLRGHFLPFGTGQRGCPGARIAQTEITVGLAVLIHALQMERVPGEALAFEWLASLRRAGGQRLSLAAAQ
jgi:cytochrome P450